MKKWIFSALVVLLSSFNFGCGGDSSSSSGAPPNNDETAEPVVNAAEQSNGGKATATYDSDNAGLVNDGDTNTATFWAGNMNGDHVTVEFDREYQLGELTVFTNRTNNMDTEIQLSTDGSDFDTVNLAGDCNVGLTMGRGMITCWTSPEMPATHIRVVITDPTNPGTVKIHEIQALGF